MGINSGLLHRRNTLPNICSTNHPLPERFSLRVRRRAIPVLLGLIVLLLQARQAVR
ncbi:hypothetical protein AB0H20_00620 [Nocardia fluminea]